jgi:hypothetical protein
MSGCVVRRRYPAGSDTGHMPAAVHLVLRDADPSGIVVATRDNWTGIAYALPAEDFTRLPLGFERPGVYALIGSDEAGEDGSPVLYLGEAEAVANRLRSGHAQLNRADIAWRRIVIFTSQADDLHKGHVRWLEAKLVEMARSAARVGLANVEKKMAFPALPEHDQVFVDSFLTNMLVLYPLLGVDAFQQVYTPQSSEQESSFPDLMLEFSLEGEVRARGKLSRNGFTLFRGSTLRNQTTDSFSASARNRRQVLQDAGHLVDRGDGWSELTSDVEVSSSSLAAVLVSGRSASGPESWRTGDNRKLKFLLA